MALAIVFAPAILAFGVGAWRGKIFSRWCFACAAAAFLLIAVTAYILPTGFAPGARASIAAIAMMAGVGFAGPAIFVSKPPAFAVSFFGALLLAIPTMYAAYYAFMSFVCAGDHAQCY